MSDPNQGTPPAAPPAATWRDTLPDDLKSDASIQKFADVPSLAKSYRELEKMRGVPADRLLTIPDKDDDKDGWGKVWSRLGRPETADKYSQVDKAVLEKAGLPPEVLAAAYAKFHELGIPDRQARGILEWYAGDAAKGSELKAAAATKARDDGITELRKEFGDQFDARMKLLPAWLKENGSDELVKWAEESGAGNNPAFVRALVKSAQRTLEASSRVQGAGGGDAGSSVEAARSELKVMIELRSKDKAYNLLFDNHKSPERLKWDALQKAANPPKP